MNRLNLFLSILVCTGLATVSSRAQSESGRVVERGTNRPLAGVYVIAEWNARVVSPVQPHSDCYHAEITVSDSDGRFALPSFSGKVDPAMFNRVRDIYPYAPGYKQSPIRSGSDSLLIMEVRGGTKEQQFAAVEDMRLSAGCHGDEMQFLPARKARAFELWSLATSQKQFETANGARYGVEKTEMGEELALQGYKERLIQRQQSTGKERK